MWWSIIVTQSHAITLVSVTLLNSHFSSSHFQDLRTTCPHHILDFSVCLSYHLLTPRRKSFNIYLIFSFVCFFCEKVWNLFFFSALIKAVRAATTSCFVQGFQTLTWLHRVSEIKFGVMLFICGLCGPCVAWRAQVIKGYSNNKRLLDTDEWQVLLSLLWLCG